ncbi:hypothetical protein SARC_00054 [Sphaeroforma arctica JP610]|uniref:Uncharacterized protein n=1 Tax=Sphaeroforma arctica JP610 TaxID=667725 RepID=A0A0L0GFJ2_9EUKA|nr:hypothetical protein SARC_00054 [Sphaeroforma arctica JP610]KNC87797.1 hypothetical protein SARC_00054 [Sphaeroforma arctica JP610]|eukprot:XP_014161699.1 hypothetical protein SARC_00054 [Sphaeroforma arctica JP610]
MGMGSRVSTCKLLGLIAIFVVSSYHLYMSLGSINSSFNADLSVEGVEKAFDYVLVPVKNDTGVLCYVNIRCEYEVGLRFLDNSTVASVDWSELVFSTLVLSNSTAFNGHFQYIADSNGVGNYKIEFTPRTYGMHDIMPRLLYSNRTAALNPSDLRQTSAHGGDANSKYLGLLPSNKILEVMVLAANVSHQENVLTTECLRNNTDDTTGHWVIQPNGGSQCVGRTVFSYDKQFNMKECETYDRPCRPLWHNAECDYPTLSSSLVTACLSRWNIHMFGDSVTRQMVSSLGHAFPSTVRSLQANETSLYPWEGYSNPRKMEFPKLFNETSRTALLALIGDKRWRTDRDVVVFNAGLHDVAFSTAEEYASYLPVVLEAMIAANFKHLIFRMTTSIHPHMIPGGPIDKHWKFTTVRVEEFNNIAIKAIKTLNKLNYGSTKTRIAIINADKMTASRSDGVLFQDMRHFCPILMLEMWSVLFHKICDT